MLLLFHHQVMSDSLWHHGLQHARLPSPSLPPRVCSNSCPLSQWCYLIISSRNFYPECLLHISKYCQTLVLSMYWSCLLNESLFSQQLGLKIYKISFTFHPFLVLLPKLRPLIFLISRVMKKETSIVEGKEIVGESHSILSKVESLVGTQDQILSL